jgi:hypothetical protein
VFDRRSDHARFTRANVLAGNTCTFTVENLKDFDDDFERWGAPFSRRCWTTALGLSEIPGILLPMHDSLNSRLIDEWLQKAGEAS